MNPKRIRASSFVCRTGAGFCLALACFFPLKARSSSATTTCFKRLSEANLVTDQKKIDEELCKASRNLQGEDDDYLDARCSNTYVTTHLYVKQYNQEAEKHCNAIKELSQITDLSQDGALDKVTELRERAAASERALAQIAKTHSEILKKEADGNKKLLARLKREREMIRGIQQCEFHSGERSRCVARTNRRSWKEIPREGEIVQVSGMEIKAKFAGTKTIEDYNERIAKIIEEQQRAYEIGARYAAELESRAVESIRNVTELSGKMSPDSPGKKEESGGSALDTSLKSMQLATMGAGLMGNRQTSSPAPNRSGGSSLPNAPGSSSISTKETSKDPVVEKVNGILAQIDKNKSEKEKGIAEDLFGGLDSGKTGSNGTILSGGEGAAGNQARGAGLSGGSIPDGFRSLASYAAEKREKGKANSSGGASRLSKEENPYNPAGGGGASTGPGSFEASETKEEGELFGSFSGQIKNQEDGLDEQSEIASILDQMQNMFEEAPGEEGAENATPATGGISRSEEIARFEQFEAKDGATQGATLAHQSEELMNFSLFSRVHVRHRKSMEKGLVIFGLRHRVN